ncbi:MAG: GAF domain-containing sensor histidine kinase [Spirochaetales bacterium]|nr:GAF domain-containing sensor histidine kinase [Spirochaetales bacterium]
MKKTNQRLNRGRNFFIAAVIIILGLWFLPGSGLLLASIHDKNHTNLFPFVIFFFGGLTGFLSSIFFFIKSFLSKPLHSHPDTLQLFCEAIKKLATTLDLKTMTDEAAEIIAGVIGVRGCSISILDTDTKKIRLNSIFGIRQPDSRVIDIPGSGLLDGKPLVVPDTKTREFPEVDDSRESLICVPLKLEEKIFGAVCIYGERGQRLSTEMISILESLSNILSLAISHAFVYENFQKLAEAKTHFIFQTSHELRSPLASIHSLTAVLLKKYIGNLNTKQEEILSRMELRLRKLSEMVNDLLELAQGRVNAANPELLKIDVIPIITDTINLFDQRIKDKGITLCVHRIPDSAIIKATEDGIRSIITNLLSNAYKYTEREGKIDLSVYENTEKDELIIEVTDTGIGIPETEIGALFTEFFRASNAKAHTEMGTGLGLPIVRAHVEKFRGRIHVESKPGKGTLFRILLPEVK